MAHRGRRERHQQTSSNGKTASRERSGSAQTATQQQACHHQNQRLQPRWWPSQPIAIYQVQKLSGHDFYPTDRFGSPARVRRAKLVLLTVRQRRFGLIANENDLIAEEIRRLVRR